MSGFFSILAEGEGGAKGGKQRAKKAKKKTDDVAPAAAEKPAVPAKAQPSAQQAAEPDANGWATTGRANKPKGASVAHTSGSESHGRHGSQQATVTAEAACQVIESQATAASGDERRGLWQGWLHQVSRLRLPGGSCRLHFV